MSLFMYLNSILVAWEQINVIFVNDVIANPYCASTRNTYSNLDSTTQEAVWKLLHNKYTKTYNNITKAYNHLVFVINYYIIYLRYDESNT